MKNKKLTKFASMIIVMLMLTCLAAPVVLAAAPTVQVTKTPASLDVVTVIEAGINWVLGLVGLIVVVLFVYAGILWTTAAGNDTQLGKARTIMTSAIIGMVISLLAYGIVKMVIAGFGIGA